MNTAGMEWAERVAARNAIGHGGVCAQNEALMAQGYLPLTYGEQPTPLSAGAVPAGTASAQQQVRRA